MVFHKNRCGTGMEHQSEWIIISYLIMRSQIINSTTGVFTDLVITDVTLEDNNTVYTCNSTDNSITSSVMLNVSGKLYVCTYCS